MHTTRHKKHPPAARNLSIDEFCGAAGISRTTAYKLIATGKLKTIKIERRRVVPPSEVERLTTVEATA